MSGQVELDPGPEAELDRLEKTQRWELLSQIEDAIDALADDPGSRASRQRAFRGGGFGITLRSRDDDWLIIWEHDGDIIAIRYIGPDPFS